MSILAKSRFHAVPFVVISIALVAISGMAHGEIPFPRCKGEVCQLLPIQGGSFTAKPFSGPVLQIGLFRLYLPGSPGSIRHDHYAITLEWHDGRKLIVMRKGNHFFQKVNKQAGVTAYDAGIDMYFITSTSAPSQDRKKRRLQQLLLFMKQVHLRGVERVRMWQKGKQKLFYSVRPAGLPGNKIRFFQVVDVFDKRMPDEFLHVVGVRFSRQDFLRLYGDRQTDKSR